MELLLVPVEFVSLPILTSASPVPMTTSWMGGREGFQRRLALRGDVRTLVQRNLLRGHLHGEGQAGGQTAVLAVGLW